MYSIGIKYGSLFVHFQTGRAAHQLALRSFQAHRAIGPGMAHVMGLGTCQGFGS